MSESELMQMVRICRDFQKYTGNDKIIVCNINSKYTPPFHIHPNLLASNFFERRQKFYDELKEVVQNIEDDDELFEYCEDEEVSFMLHHFGIQTVIQKIDRYKKKLEIKKLKEEQIAAETNQKKNKNNKNKSDPFNLRQQRIRIRNKKSYFEKISDKPLPFILWCFANLYNGEKVTIKTLSFIHQRACIMLDLGITADSCKVQVFKMIKKTSSSQLHKQIRDIKYFCKGTNFKHVDRKQMILICNDLRSWTNNGVNGVSNIAEDYKHKAIKLLSKHFFNYYDCKLCHYPHMHNIKNSENFGSELLMDVSSRNISNKHHYAKTIGVIKICIANNLITRVEELNILGIACAIVNESFIALKMIKCAYKLSNGYITDDAFAEEQVLETIENLKKLWWDMKCNGCGIRAKELKRHRKHKACTGCMKVVYCCRECQKIDWNAQHRVECDKSWISIYDALRMSILDRL